MKSTAIALVANIGSKLYLANAAVCAGNYWCFDLERNGGGNRSYTHNTEVLFQVSHYNCLESSYKLVWCTADDFWNNDRLGDRLT